MNNNMKKTISAVLAVALVGGGLLLRAQTAKKEEHYAHLTAQLAEELAAAQTAYNTVDTSALDSLSSKLKDLEAANAEMEARIKELDQEDALLDQQTSDLEREYEALSQDEDNAYYLAVYESVRKGMDKVEEYLNGE